LISILGAIIDVRSDATKLEGYRAGVAALRLLADAQPLFFLAQYGSLLRGLSLEAHNRGLDMEAESTMMESVGVLRNAVELQGNVHLRSLGFSMRYAIDKFGHKELQDEYDKLVKREVEYISSRRILKPEMPGINPSWKKHRWWWPFK
jgi:hypothetical protein